MAKKAMYNYVLSGLNVSSEFEFLIAPICDFDGEVDVTVSFTNALDFPVNAVQHPEEPHVQMGNNDVWFQAMHGLAFRIIGGDKILIERADGIADADVNLFLVGSCFGVLCLQRGLIPIHCSAIETKSRAIGITGASGVGKSTTAAALSQLGFPHVCDDVLVIDPTIQPFQVTAMPKGLKLWEEAAEALNIATEKKATTIEGLNKYYVSPTNTQLSSNLGFETLYVMDEDDAEAFKITELKGLEKHTELRRAIYREEWLDLLQPREATFASVTKLAKNLRVFKFKRPDNLDLVYKSAEFLISHFEQME